MRAGVDVEAVQLRTSIVPMHQQQCVRIGVPASYINVTRQRQRVVTTSRCQRLPYRRTLDAFPLVNDRKSLVADNRRPRSHANGKTIVGELVELDGVCRTQHAEPEMQDVSVFGMTQTQQRSISRESARCRLPLAAEAERVL